MRQWPLDQVADRGGVEVSKRKNPDIILRNINPDCYERAVKIAKTFAKDWPDRAAGDWVVYSERSQSYKPSCVIHWTKAGAIVVRADSGWVCSP